MIHFFNRYRCRSQDWGVFECEGCGDTYDWAANNQTLTLSQHGAGCSLWFCSSVCLLDWAQRGADGLVSQLRPTAPFGWYFDQHLARLNGKDGGTK